MFFNANSEPISIEKTYKNQALFITLCGPSLVGFNLDLLRQPGIITMGVNNSPKVFRPNLWVSVDSPSNFLYSIWRDPLITKFIHLGKQDKQLYDSSKRKMLTHIKSGECPNIVYWKDNEYFQPNKFLTEDTINWGNHTDRCECGYFRLGKNETCRCKTSDPPTHVDGQSCSICKKPFRLALCPKCKKAQWGSRTVMLSVVRIAHILGFNKVFLLGADFKMSETQKYAFSQDRSASSIKNNNQTYERLNLRFNQLRPIFEKNRFYVWNCTPDSGLKSFDYMDYNLALKIALKDFPDTKNEPSSNMYDREAQERERKRQRRKDLESKRIDKLNKEEQPCPVKV